MLETEALKKWCPFTRTTDGQGMTINRYALGYGVPEECNCIGAACMVWCSDSPVSVREDSKARGHCGLVLSMEG